MRGGDAARLVRGGEAVDAFYKADGATLDDLRESVTTLEDLERTTRRVMGGAHPITGGVEITLRNAQAALVACETPSPPPGGEA